MKTEVYAWSDLWKKWKWKMYEDEKTLRMMKGYKDQNFHEMKSEVESGVC